MSGFQQSQTPANINNVPHQYELYDQGTMHTTGINQWNNEYAPETVTVMDIDTGFNQNSYIEMKPVTMQQYGKQQVEMQQVGIEQVGIQQLGLQQCSRNQLGRTGRVKRVRTNFTSEQLSELEDYFKGSRYLSRQDRIKLSNQLNLNERQVKIWFQNRRMKDKREKGLLPRAGVPKIDVQAPIATGAVLDTPMTTPDGISSDSDEQISQILMRYQNHGNNNNILHGSQAQISQAQFSHTYKTRPPAKCDKQAEIVASFVVYDPFYETHDVSSEQQPNESATAAVADEELIMNAFLQPIIGANGSHEEERIPKEEQIYDELHHSELRDESDTISNVQQDLNSSTSSTTASVQQFDDVSSVLFYNVDDLQSIPDVSKNWSLCPQDEYNLINY